MWFSNETEGLSMGLQDEPLSREATSQLQVLNLHWQE